MNVHLRSNGLTRSISQYARALPILRDLRNYIQERRLGAWSDRRYLLEVLFPALTSGDNLKVLFVGCRRYTKDYGRTVRNASVDYWTVDIDPAAARWGQPSHHLICDISKIDGLVAWHSFDVVFLNGVFGFGVDDPDTMNRTLAALHKILTPQGVLLVGWYSGHIQDPLTLARMQELFRQEAVGALPKRKEFSDSTHVFDLYVPR
jgi:hypothetical protein